MNYIYLCKRGKRDAGQIQKDIQKLTGVNKQCVHDPKICARLKNGDTISIDNALAFNEDYIHNHTGFGNGVTCTHLTLKDGRQVSVVISVFATPLTGPEILKLQNYCKQ